ncbi:hypothetical protein B9Z19DRAFT_1131087 [Tuber borchii]|uniref:GPI anchored protein n=1 Tax=Tuber borchii TaxID=42251 RepID=A0A2T6ZJJ4_TUBBO|nr:hypothetical protein B9Z19DRAFT_1131087 [Tuber borchii]
MKNFAQLYFLAALAVGQSLAADISAPLLVRNSLLVGVPESEVSGLGKRQGSLTTYCPAGSFECPGNNGCCDIGSQCLPNAKCSGGCGAGSTECFGSCCDAGYACQGANQPCLKVDVSTNTMSMPIGGVSTTSMATLVSSPTSMPTTTKAATGTTLANTYPTGSMKSTYSISKSMPTPPSMTPGGYPNSTVTGKANSTVTSKANSSSPAIIPVGGGNSLKPAAWLGGLGIALFFAFFHM